MRVIASFLFYFLCSVILFIALAVVVLIGLEIVNWLIKDLTGIDAGKTLFMKLKGEKE